MINSSIHNGHHLLNTYSAPGTAPIRARAWLPAIHILGALSDFLLGLYLLIFARQIPPSCGIHGPGCRGPHQVRGSPGGQHHLPQHKASPPESLCQEVGVSQDSCLLVCRLVDR